MLIEIDENLLVEIENVSTIIGKIDNVTKILSIFSIKKTCDCGDVVDLLGDRDYSYINGKVLCAVCMDNPD